MRANKSFLIKFVDPKTLSFWVGLALAQPFIIDMLPPILRRYSLLLIVPLIMNILINIHNYFAILFRNIRLLKFNINFFFLSLIIILWILHAYGLRIGMTPYRETIISDIIRTAFIVGIFFMGGYLCDRRMDMINGFFYILIPFSVVLAIVGIFKLFLLERGFLLSFLFSFQSYEYPAGSCLQRDYNLFGLSILVAALGMTTRTFSKKTTNLFFFWTSFVLALLITAGIFTGSRRFLILSIMIPIFWFITAIYRNAKLKIYKKVIFHVSMTLGIVGFLYWFINSPVQPKNYIIIRFDQAFLENIIDYFRERKEEKWSGKTFREYYSEKSNTELEKFEDVKVMNTNPGTILGTLEGKTIYGLDSRVERWQFGMELLSSNGWFNGGGFSYHKAFSCRFVDCAFIDYPHLPIISEWLIGGIFGLAVAAGIYIVALLVIWRLGYAGFKSGSSAIAAVVIPYSMISGDTIFSIPQFLIVCLLAQGQMLWQADIDKGQRRIET